MSYAAGTDLAIDVRQVRQNGIRFDLARVAIPSRPTAEDHGAPVWLWVKAELGQPARGQAKLLDEKEVHLDFEEGGGTIDFGDLARRAAAGDAPVGFLVPPYKWIDTWPNGQACVTHRRRDVILQWKDRLPPGTEIIVDFGKRIRVAGMARRQDMSGDRPGGGSSAIRRAFAAVLEPPRRLLAFVLRRRRTSKYVLYIEDGMLPPRTVHESLPASGAPRARPEPSPDQDRPLRSSQTIQGNVLAGFNKDHQVFLFLRFRDGESARRWLHELSHHIATTAQVTWFNDQFKEARKHGDAAAHDLKEWWLNVGFTYTGICALAPDASDDLKAFKAFCDGPARRAKYLGDVNESAPERWVIGDDVDALLTIAADDVDDLRAKVREHLVLAARWGLEPIYQQRGDTLPGSLRGHEHFGFRDGVSQPRVRGYAKPADYDSDQDNEHPGSRIVDAEKFVLGQGSPMWMKDGSFQVFRRLAQDVPGFIAQISSMSEVPPPEEQLTPGLLAARLIGRWPSGTPLALAPIRDYRPTNFKDDNDFNYYNDKDGLKTPLYAHIRKQNPRNRDADRHRILRRGIPYGPVFDPAEDQGGPYGASAERDRGLCFNAFMASIEEQFEYLQRERANGRGPRGLDSLVFTKHVQRRLRLRRIGGSRQRAHLRSYVHTTGAVYAFAPSLPGLHKLAEGKLREPHEPSA
jgi:Dyp-type peroxidase family